MDRPYTPGLAAILLIAGFCLQHVLIVAYGEPYPALKMPAFTGGGQPHDRPQTFRIVRFRVEFLHGPARTLTARQLLWDVPTSQRRAIVFNTFGPHRWESEHAGVDIAPDGWLPGRELWWKRRADASRAFKAAAWLRTRLEDIYPAQCPTSVTVLWYESRVVDSSTIEHTLIKSGQIII